ncbi:hypothetical protein HY491_02740 [Candidatus Woesearchaeota archaeon]|nr:hypothetical protein [Candidatus Woesearchaeota archaeon]
MGKLALIGIFALLMSLASAAEQGLLTINTTVIRAAIECAAAKWCASGEELASIGAGCCT